jgi:TPR repeat protein
MDAEGTLAKLSGALLLMLSFPACAAMVSGTGFFISSDGFIATNFHVVDGADEIRVRDSSGRIEKATLALRDVANDIAVLKIGGSNHPVLTIRSSLEARKGLNVFTLGFPNATIQGRESKVTEGIISSLSGLGGEPNSFQISVPIQPGNSGGPLIDMTGAVLGLTTSKLGQMFMLKQGGTLPENVNYSVKSNYLLELLATDSRVGYTKASSTKTLPLTTLVGLAENAVVFIVVSTKDAVQGERSQLSKQPETPRYVRDAAAEDNFRTGQEAYLRQDYQGALIPLGKASDLGHPEAQFILASMYRNGRGVRKDSSEAARLYLKSAEQGFKEAQFNLALTYSRGEGVTIDKDAGFKWALKAAEQGHVKAQGFVGMSYIKGEGVPKDAGKAANWLRKAAEQNDALAQYSLGVAYLRGEGVPRDSAIGIKWLRTAAEQGDATAQAILGEWYQGQYGGEKDEAEAIKWLKKAAAQGNDRAQQALRKLGQ